jgi:hypothetical protein
MMREYRLLDRMKELNSAAGRNRLRSNGEREMVRKILGACLLVALSDAWTPTAAKDDSPAQSSSQNDIKRGANAASDCGTMTWSTEDYSSCIDHAVARAMDNSAASMSFQLGIYCSAFFQLALAHRTGTWKQYQIDLDSAKVATVDQYGSCIFSAHSLGFKVDRICAVLGLSCAEFNDELRHWRGIGRDGM